MCSPPSRVITKNDLMNVHSRAGFRCGRLYGGIMRQRKQLAVTSTNLCSTPGEICTWSPLQFTFSCIKICCSGSWNICSVEERSLRRRWLWCACKYFCLNTSYSSRNLGRWQYQYRRLCYLNNAITCCPTQRCHMNLSWDKSHRLKS